MKPEDIITLFEQYVDDATELSSAQELALLQKIFAKVWNQKPWEFTKGSVSGTYALTTPNIPKPADFSSFLENNTYTDNTVSIENNAAAKVLFIGSAYTPYQIINWSDRRQYRSQLGYAYLDLPNSGISLTGTPIATDLYEFDYKKQAPTLVIGTLIPGIPTDYQHMLYHGMAVDDEIIQRWPRAQAYAQDNQAAYNDFLQQMAMWNAALQLN